MKIFAFYALWLLSALKGFAQEAPLTLAEYFAYIKKYHPVVKQAQLVLSEAEAKRLKARGAFDPKLAFRYDKKAFDKKDYYDRRYASFKIPAWYGIAIQGGFENNNGVFLNPEANVPQGGLYHLGLSVALAKDLVINPRMAALKQAKLYVSQAAADTRLLVNEILYQAALAYFDWLKAYKERQTYEEFVSNAQQRLAGMIKSYETGEKPAIDTTEARIAYNSRTLKLENATLNYTVASLTLSNYLWIDGIPVELKDTMEPDTLTYAQVDAALNIEAVNTDLSQHPKLRSLNLKAQSLKIEQQLKKNNLLPQINAQYNFITPTPQDFNTYSLSDYKIRVTAGFPLFLRKARADLKLVKLKLQSIAYDKQAVGVSLRNKLTATQQQMASYQKQMTLAQSMITDYATLLKGEERKFSVGESSLFLINSREAKLIESRLKAIATENALLKAKGKLFHTLANN